MQTNVFSSGKVEQIFGLRASLPEKEDNKVSSCRPLNNLTRFFLSYAQQCQIFGGTNQPGFAFSKDANNWNYEICYDHTN